MGRASGPCGANLQLGGKAAGVDPRDLPGRLGAGLIDFAYAGHTARNRPKSLGVASIGNTCVRGSTLNTDFASGLARTRRVI